MWDILGYIQSCSMFTENISSNTWCNSWCWSTLLYLIKAQWEEWRNPSKPGHLCPQSRKFTQQNREFSLPSIYSNMAMEHIPFVADFPIETFIYRGFSYWNTHFELLRLMTLEDMWQTPMKSHHLETVSTTHKTWWLEGSIPFASWWFFLQIWDLRKSAFRMLQIPSGND